MWFHRRMPRIPWTARETSQELMQRAVHCDKEETDKFSGAHTQKEWTREELPVRYGERKKSKRTTTKEIHEQKQGYHWMRGDG